MLRAELALVGTGGSPLFQLALHHFGEELFRLDQGNLHVAVGIALEEELLLHETGKDIKYREGLGGQAGLDEVILRVPVGQFIELFGLLSGEEFVDLGDQPGELGNEFHDTFGDDDHAEVLAVRRALFHGISDVSGDLREGHLLLSHFLTDEADVGLGLQGAFQGNVGSGTAHDLDEMPVLLGGIGIAGDVADQFGIRLGRGVKTEGSFDIFVLQVAVDRLGAADDLDAGVVGSHVLGQHSRVGVGIVAADDHDRGQAVSGSHFGHDLELFFRFQLGTAGTDDVETAGVAVFIDKLIRKLNEIIVDQSGGAALEAKEDVVAVRGLERIVQAADHVMPAGSLAAGKDHADHLLLRRGVVAALFEGDFVVAVGVGEEGLDLVLIRHTFGGRADFDGNPGNTAAERRGKFGAVLISCFLKG